MQSAWTLLAFPALPALLAACGARTGLGAPLPADASADAGLDVDADAPRDAAHDVTGDAPVLAPGCADGQREGFVDGVKFPAIAACSGGFSIGGVMPFVPASIPQCPGVVAHDTLAPACNRAGGDDGPNPTGAGCDVEDLCAAGWHVCRSAGEVAMDSPSGCDGATGPTDPPTFFATRQSSDGCGDCATGTGTGPACDSMACAPGCAETALTSNDVFGCGNVASTVAFTGCGPFDTFTNNACSALAGSWSCAGDPSGYCEAYALVHLDASGGGVLCCRD